MLPPERVQKPSIRTSVAAPESVDLERSFSQEFGADGRRSVRALWVSDVHLGTRGAQTDALVEFLSVHRPERLYLVGDIIDWWVLRKRWYWNDSHDRVVDAVLAAAAEGTRVTWIAGNHDEFLRGFLGARIQGVRVVDDAVHTMADGRRLLVIHGDRFDRTLREAPWLAHVGDVAYRGCMTLNGALARVQRWMGRDYWSFSKWIKARVKGAVNYVTSFEDEVLSHARGLRLDGAVCGHVHTACLREQDGMIYANDGDWVESCSALVETLEGELQLIDWPADRQGALYSRALAMAGGRL